MSDAAAIWDGRPRTTVGLLGELNELLSRFDGEPPAPDEEPVVDGDSDPGAPRGLGSDT